MCIAPYGLAARSMKYKRTQLIHFIHRFQQMYICIHLPNWSHIKYRKESKVFIINAHV